METFVLKILFTIQGIGAASGLIYNDDALYIISDNSNYLYTYSINREQLDTILMMNRSVNVQVPKKRKADFEATTLIDGTVHIFGSGSSPRRNLSVRYDSATRNIEQLNMRKVYASIRKQYAIDKADFNIEGALMTKGELWLFNRGNGPQSLNGIIVLDGNSMVPKAFHPVSLPELNDVQLGFTDAILVEDKVYFIAAAEGSNSVYDDGEIQGTILGRLDPTTMQVEYRKLISSTHKFEGITLFQKTASRLEFLLCEDPDNDAPESQIYHLQLER